MALLELGDREDLENAIRKGCAIPLAVLGGLMVGGMLVHVVPPLVGFVGGGGIGGGLGYFLGALVLRLLRMVWPPAGE